MSALTRTVADWRPARSTLLYGALVLYTEFLLVAAYFLFGDANLIQPLYTVYGLVWVNVGLWVFARARVAPASARTRRRSALVAVGYFAVLAVAGGLASAGVSHPGLAHTHATGFAVSWLPPGWGPALVYRGALVQLVLMPAKVVGYAALAYLVYATAVDVLAIVGDGDRGGSEARSASSAAVSGALGLFSCVSCSWPILASLATGLLGGGSAAASTAFGLSYDLSTAVFLLTVGLLYWRPFGR